MYHELQAAFEDMFLRYNVDLYFAGHVHAYERTHPVFREASYELPFQSHSGGDLYTDPTMPIHVTIGNAGVRCANRSGVARVSLTLTLDLASSLVEH